MKGSVVAMIGAGALFAASGYAAAHALAQAQADPVRTVTVNVATGPRGPQGPPGPPGPSGTFDCPNGFSVADLVINHPGGQTTIRTCVKD